jgi:hypothetical protein
MPGVEDMAGAMQQATAEDVVQEWAMAVHFRQDRVVDWARQKAGDADSVRVRAAEQLPVADTSLMKIKTGSVMSTNKALQNKICH